MTKRNHDADEGSLREVSQKTLGPASASLQKHMRYGGSRQHKGRWEYSETSGCGFAELSEHNAIDGDGFKALLEKRARCE